MVYQRAVELGLGAKLALTTQHPDRISRHIGSLGAAIRIADRDVYAEGRPFPHLALDVHKTPVILHNSLHDAEAQSRSRPPVGTLRGEEGLEDPVHDLGRNARA